MVKAPLTGCLRFHAVLDCGVVKKIWAWVSGAGPTGGNFKLRSTQTIKRSASGAFADGPVDAMAGAEIAPTSRAIKLPDSAAVRPGFQSGWGVDQVVSLREVTMITGGWLASVPDMGGACAGFWRKAIQTCPLKVVKAGPQPIWVIKSEGLFGL